MKVLLELGAEVNARDEAGVTPLWQAAYGGGGELVEELLKWSPDLDARQTKTNWTALHAAYDDPDIENAP